MGRVCKDKSRGIDHYSCQALRWDALYLLTSITELSRGCWPF